MGIITIVKVELEAPLPPIYFRNLIQCAFYLEIYNINHFEISEMNVLKTPDGYYSIKKAGEQYGSHNLDCIYDSRGNRYKMALANLPSQAPFSSYNDAASETKDYSHRYFDDSDHCYIITDEIKLKEMPERFMTLQSIFYKEINKQKIEIATKRKERLTLFGSHDGELKKKREEVKVLEIKLENIK